MTIQDRETELLSDVELDAVVGSQAEDPNRCNFYNNPTFGADYVLYPHSELA